MVDHVGGYYGKDFKGFQRVTQRNSLYLTNINVMEDAVVLHWILLVAGGV